MKSNHHFYRLIYYSFRGVKSKLMHFYRHTDVKLISTQINYSNQFYAPQIDLIYFTIA